MAQALSEWQQFLQWIQRELRVRSRRISYKLPSASQLKVYRSWLVGVGVLALVIWHWKLALSLGTGGLAMFVAYSSQGWNWQRIRNWLDRLWDRQNQQFTLTLASGGVATLGTYMVLALWTGMENHALAIAIMLQGMATLGVLGLLVRAQLMRRSTRRHMSFDRQLDRLTDTDPLIRAIAVRQILRLWQEAPLEPTQRQAAADAFRLMLRREPESLVRNAVLEGLKAMGELKTLTSGTPPISIPIEKSKSYSQHPIN